MPTTPRFQKIYSTLELEEAHVFQALMRRNGMVCWLLKSNGMDIDPEQPLADAGYKLFVLDHQFRQAEKFIQETFLCSESGPFVGSFDMNFGVGKNRHAPRTQLKNDSIGPEFFLWNPPAGDPIGDEWMTAATVCPKCLRQMAPGDSFCDQCGESLAPELASRLRSCNRCGHEMPAGASACPTCGEIH